MRGKAKIVALISFTGVIAISFGLIKSNDLKSEELAVEKQQLEVEEITSGQLNTFLNRDVTTTISVEEQEMAENSLLFEGFVPQKDGTGFYFKKESLFY